MPSDYQLLAPGPVQLHPEVQRILGLPMIHHRTPEFDLIFKRVLAGLKHVFGTTQDVFLHASTGSGGMESLLVNTLSPGDRVLVIVSGKFGERWAEMGRAYGLTVHTIDVPWGEAVAPHHVADFLRAHPDTKAVFTQACETSTAVLHPIRELAALTKPISTLLLVDGITAVGVLPLPMDEWGIDGLVAGSQKAFMLPTGLSFVSLSAKAWKAVETSRLPKYYFDLKREREANRRGETFFSSAVPLIRALDWVLDTLQKQGLESQYHSIERRAQATRTFAALVGLQVYSQSPSPSLTALKMPTGIDSQKVRAELETRHGITVMGGQDQLKGKVLRIGHMGAISDEDQLRLFEKLMDVLAAAPGAEAIPNLSKRDSILQEMATWLKTNP